MNPLRMCQGNVNLWGKFCIMLSVTARTFWGTPAPQQFGGRFNRFSCRLSTTVPLHLHIVEDTRPTSLYYIPFMHLFHFFIFSFLCYFHLSFGSFQFQAVTCTLLRHFILKPPIFFIRCHQFVCKLLSDDVRYVVSFFIQPVQQLSK